MMEKRILKGLTCWERGVIICKGGGELAWYQETGECRSKRSAQAWLAGRLVSPDVRKFGGKFCKCTIPN